MLFPGHAAVGYLATRGVLSFATGLSPAEVHHLALWGMFWGVIPDIDVLIPFAFLRTAKLRTEMSHRRIFTHTPIFWLVLSLAAYFIFHDFYFALVMLVGSWSHFLADSIEYGIMWLWPFSKRQFALRRIPDKDEYLEGSTVNFYWQMFKNVYTRNITFWIELVMILKVAVLLLQSRGL
jgi:hypothetical protein